ncbi:hypothetical protein DX933_08465 [Ornithinibacillus gellani]|uniref:tetratricopeptide repeat protein n=1 Tax=Ornithinibacillus gellani TaxID=2293253 RepID=UPI000F48D088|nr:hypothetical protein [Ornithinibacillus gellani]TQS74800.1 hypothetical protein DX933_08465 [Ornithinibacillus gellani]
MQGSNRGFNRKKQQHTIIPFIPDGDFYFTKGVEAFQKHKFELALKWLKKAVEIAPENPLYLCQISIIYTEIGSFHKANQLLTTALQSSGNQYTDCYYLLANNYAHLGLLQDAKKYASSYLEREPDGDFHEEAQELLDYISFDEEDMETEWEMDDEDELLIYQETVFYYMENMEWEKALILLEEMLTLFPEHKTTKHDLAYAMFFSGEQQAALEMELKLLADNPDSLYSHVNLAIFYYELGQMSACELHIHTLRNVYPLHEQQKLNIAVALARTGNFQEANARFNLLRKGSMRGHASYYRWSSKALYRVGELGKSLAIWEEGCRRHPQLSAEEGPWDS